MKKLQEKQAKIEKIASKANTEVTFKPQTNKLDSKMEKKINELRKNYRLEKEHTKSPIKELNKERIKTEAALARKRVQQFLERNNLAQQQRELHLQQLMEEFGEGLISASQNNQYQSNKHSEELLKESEKYKDKDLWERQKLFMSEKEEKIKNLKKEKEDEKAILDVKFIKTTNKKNLGDREKRPREVDQSAKTREGEKNTHSKQQSDHDRDASPDLRPDWQEMLLEGQPGIDRILLKFHGEATPDPKSPALDNSDYRLTPENKSANQSQV